ncbi:MAG: agarase [Pirellulaceae bacterium]|nr:agarase [Pirellulaceae bacterium]
MRRRFVATTACSLLLSHVAGGGVAMATTQSQPDGFFTVGKRNDRWWFIQPDGSQFFSLGMNHIDPATLRYPENVQLWKEKYGNSMQRWLQESVAKDLEAWGFNSIGWTQEVVTRGLTNHRHSRSFTFQEYQWLDMPYCHLLPFADFHQWEAETKHPDFFSDDFANWCDHVAREHCVPLADDPKLIGYFYIDCPTWVHTRKENTWKGPLFDPEKLKSPDGQRELFELATKYYQVTHDAIRRYDPHHLILGDRFEINAPLPVEVVRAAKAYVDVLSFQQFSEPEKVRVDFEHWRQTIDMPILLADGAGSRTRSDGSKGQDGRRYARTLEVLRANPACIGFHLCGAYLTNRVRQRGLRDENDVPDQEAIALIKAANHETKRWVH